VRQGTSHKPGNTTYMLKVQGDRLQSAENYRQTEGIKGRLHSHGTHAQRYDTHAETDWGRLITLYTLCQMKFHYRPCMLLHIGSYH